MAEIPSRRDLLLAGPHGETHAGHPSPGPAADGFLASRAAEAFPAGSLVSPGPRRRAEKNEEDKNAAAGTRIGKAPGDRLTAPGDRHGKNTADPSVCALELHHALCAAPGRGRKHHGRLSAGDEDRECPGLVFSLPRQDVLAGKPGRLLPLCEGHPRLAGPGGCSAPDCRDVRSCPHGAPVSLSAVRVALVPDHPAARHRHRKGRRGCHGRSLYVYHAHRSLRRRFLGCLRPGGAVDPRKRGDGRRRSPGGDRPGGRDIRPGRNLEKQRHPFPSRPCRDGKQFHGTHQSRRGAHRRRQAGRGPPASRDGSKDQARLPQRPVQPRRHRHAAGQKRRGDGSFQGHAARPTPTLHGHPITRGSFICNGESPPRPCSTFKGPWRAGAPTRRSSPPLPMLWP